MVHAHPPEVVAETGLEDRARLVRERFAGTLDRAPDGRRRRERGNALRLLV